MVEELEAIEEKDWGVIHPSLERWSTAIHEYACQNWDKEDVDDDKMVCHDIWKFEGSWSGLCLALSRGIRGDRIQSVDEAGPFWNDESVEVGTANMYRSFLGAIRDEIVSSNPPGWDTLRPEIIVDIDLSDVSRALIILEDTVLLSFERKTWYFCWETLAELNDEMAELTATARLKYELCRGRIVEELNARVAVILSD